MRPFIVVGTPRSGTAWLAEFLSTLGRPCRHEPSLRFQQPEDLDRWLLSDGAAASDSMMTFLAPRAKQLRPDLFTVVVRRPLTEVRASFFKLGLEIPHWYLEMMDRQAAAIPADLSVSFADLDNEETGRQIFEGCTQMPFEQRRWAEMRRTNVQSDIQDTLALLTSNNEAHLRVYGPHYDAHAPD